jgi:hypothetical protein
VIPRSMNFMCRHFGTLCQVQLDRRCKFTPPMKMDLTVCSETSAYKIQTQGNKKKRIQHTEYGKSLKSKRKKCSEHTDINRNFNAMYF